MTIADNNSFEIIDRPELIIRDIANQMLGYVMMFSEDVKHRSVINEWGNAIPKVFLTVELSGLLTLL